MRTLKRREQTIYTVAPVTTTGAYGSKTTNPTGTAYAAQGTVQPLASGTARMEFGERVTNMMLLIVPRATQAEIGWGVRLAGESGAPWEIVKKAQWQDLTQLTIEKRSP